MKKLIMMKALCLEWKMSGKAGRVRLGREPHTEPWSNQRSVLCWCGPMRGEYHLVPQQPRQLPPGQLQLVGAALPSCAAPHLALVAGQATRWAARVTAVCTENGYDEHYL